MSLKDIFTEVTKAYNPAVSSLHSNKDSDLNLINKL